jgi:hypothetical protein
VVSAANRDGIASQPDAGVKRLLAELPDERALIG